MGFVEPNNALLDLWLDRAENQTDKGWSGQQRADARARVQKMGLPNRRDEYWKYTRPDGLTEAAVPTAELLSSEDQAIFSGFEQIKIVFVDGVFSPELSDALDGHDVSIELLSQTQTQEAHWASDIFGQLEAAGQSPVERPLAALNTALAEDGVLVHAKGATSKPVHLIYLRQNQSCDVMLHHVVKVDSGASLSFLESGAVGARSNLVLETDIEAAGSFRHVRIQGRDHQRLASTHQFARLRQESTFKSFTLTANGALTRNECVIELLGDDGIAHVAGACVGDGDFVHDDTVFVTHDAVGCESRQVFKKVLRNGATGVFQGKILVKQDAQKTDGYQISQSLLLDEDSQFLAKPELEIYADDVACSHGSTSGAVDEDALFYLRSRGVPKAMATDMLTLSFLAEAVDEIDDAELINSVVEWLEGWLERRRT